MRKNKGNLLVGLIAILPVIVVYEIIEFVPDWIYNPIKDVLGSSEFISKILGFCIICVVLWLIGGIINGEIGNQLKKWVASVIIRIPVIGYLYQVVSQILDTINNTNSFKEVVIVKLLENVYIFAYVSHEHAGYIWIHTPSVPAPWTGPLPTVVKEDAVIRTNIKVRTLFDSVISLGTSSSTKDMIEELKKRLKEMKEKKEGDYVVESHPV